MADTKVYPNTDLRWKLPLRGDSFGTYIFDADQQMIAQSRGWGHLTGGGGLKLDADTAEAIQKARLDEIAPPSLPELDREDARVEAQGGSPFSQSSPAIASVTTSTAC